MELRAEEISQIIKEQITDYDKKVELSETGVVLSVGDGIARMYGLEKAMANELVEFPGGIMGLVLNLEEDNVGVAVMGEDIHIKEGDIVKRTGKIAEVPVGEAVLGRVVSTVGEPLDGKGPIETKEIRRVEMVAPGLSSARVFMSPVIRV
jgi:F-type H+-transporting ATPase subunit alpha